jgi:hypothetical protein
MPRSVTVRLSSELHDDLTRITPKGELIEHTIAGALVDFVDLRNALGARYDLVVPHLLDGENHEHDHRNRPLGSDGSDGAHRRRSRPDPAGE